MSKRKKIPVISFKEKKMCLGKIKHGSVSSVEYKISLTRNIKGKHSNLNYYKCEFCGFYHIGHNKQL